MDDEASLLPRKLQAALEQALEQRNDIINQDSDSESDEGKMTDIITMSSLMCLYIFKDAQSVNIKLWCLPERA